MIETINEWGYRLGETLQAQLASGSAAAVFVVFAAGFLTSLTPCVYPVYPVTITYIGGSSGGSRRRAALLSAAYVGGLAAVYATLGVVAALLGKTFGAFWRTPWVFGGVGLLIVVLGLGMLDLYTIRLPGFLSGVQSAGVKRGGYLGAFAVGGGAAFVTAPCTAPVLGALLGYVAAGQNVAWGAFLLLVFALGLGLLLLVLGISSGFLSSLPRPGPWMDWVKKGFGIAMLAMGGWFLWVAWGLATRGGA